MNTKDVVKHFGTKEDVWAALKIYRQRWDYWCDKGIPRGWQFEIQHLTGGKLKADRK